MLRLLSRLFSNSRSALILEQAPQAVLTIDRQNRITFFNASAERLWAVNKEQVVGQSASILLPETVRERITAGNKEPHEVHLEDSQG